MATSRSGKSTPRAGDATGKAAARASKQHADEIKKRENEISTTHAKAKAQLTEEILDPRLNVAGNSEPGVQDGRIPPPPSADQILPSPPPEADGNVYDPTTGQVVQPEAPAAPSAQEAPKAPAKGKGSDAQPTELELAQQRIAELEAALSAPRNEVVSAEKSTDGSDMVVIRTIEDIERMTFGYGNDYSFVAGQKYLVEREVAEHLASLDYLYSLNG